MRPFDRHLRHAELAAIADGKAIDSLAPKTARHLATCARCTALLHGHRAARSLLLREGSESELPQPATTGAPRSFGGAVVGLSGAAVVLALLIAVVIALPRLPSTALASPGTSATPTPSAGSPAPSEPQASSSASSTPPAFWTPTPAPSAIGPWTVLMNGNGLHGTFSPDGAHLLAYNGNTATLFAGTERVRDLAGETDMVAWIDDTSFLALRLAGSPDGSVEQVDSDHVTPVDLPDVYSLAPLVGSGHGQAAYVQASSVGTGRTAETAETFSIWDGQTTTSGIPGRPLAWSLDGKRLAVWHFAETANLSSLGWLSILAWPSLTPLFVDRDARTEHGDVAFDPSGRYVSYGAAAGVQVIDVDAGTTSTVGVFGASVAWDAASQLLYPDGQGTVVTYSPSGDRISDQPNGGDFVVGAPDGAVAASYFRPEEGPPGALTVFGPAGISSVDLPGTIDPLPLTVASGTGAIFVSVDSSAGETAFELAPSTPGPPPTSSPPPTSPPATTIGPWTVLTTGTNLQGAYSPDGAYLLVTDLHPFNGTSETTSVTLFKGTQVVRTLPEGDAVGAWIDSSSFLVLLEPEVFVGRVDSDVLTPVDVPDIYQSMPILGSGHGQVAYVSAASVSDPNDPQGWQSRIWDGTAVSDPLPGIASFWSRDGTRLGIWHYAEGRIPDLSGWIEIVSWPSLTPIFTDRNARAVPYGEGFDPSGRYFSYLSTQGAQVVDLDAGTTTTVGPALSQIGYTVAWDSASHLLIAEGGTVVTYTASGAHLSDRTGAGNRVVASPDGTVVASYFRRDGSPGALTILEPAGIASVDIPGSRLFAGPPVIAAGSGAIFVAPDGEVGENGLEMTPPVSVARDPTFLLTLAADKPTYAANDPIQISAQLQYVGEAPTTTMTGSGDGIVAFGIEQLDGPVDTQIVRHADCRQYVFQTGDVTTVPFQKSGAFDATDPLAPFWQTFYADPQLRLPTGHYRITAQASYGTPACGDEQTVTVSVLIDVQ